MTDAEKFERAQILFKEKSGSGPSTNTTADKGSSVKGKVKQGGGFSVLLDDDDDEEDEE